LLYVGVARKGYRFIGVLAGQIWRKKLLDHWMTFIGI